MRTLLFTDVVDSTRGVERLGDARAAEVWAAHDHGGNVNGFHPRVVRLHRLRRVQIAREKFTGVACRSR